MHKIIADILTRDASWGSCLPDYRLKPLRFIPLFVVRVVHKQSRRDETLLVILYKGWRVRIESARFRENEIRHERTTANRERPLCACVKRGAEIQGTEYGETARSFRWCQGCPQGNRRFLPSQLGARIIREFLEKEGSWWAIAVIKRPL